MRGLVQQWNQTGCADSEHPGSGMSRRNRAATSRTARPAASKDHPFHDGNKRTALVVAETFLELNGHELSADDQDCYRVLTAVAAGELNEEQLFEWFENHTIKVLV